MWNWRVISVNAYVCVVLIYQIPNLFIMEIFQQIEKWREQCNEHSLTLYLVFTIINSQPTLIYLYSHPFPVFLPLKE